MLSHQDISTLYVPLVKTPRVLRVLCVSQSYSHQQFYFSSVGMPQCTSESADQLWGQKGCAANPTKAFTGPQSAVFFPWPCSACSPQAESINLTENPVENRKHDICKDILRATIATLQFGLLQATDCAAEVDCLNRFIYFKGSLLPTSASHSV